MLARPALLFLFMALFLAASGCSKSSGGEQPPAEARPAWRTFSVPEGRFSILMLTGEETTWSQQNRPEGPIKTIEYSAIASESPTEGRIYCDPAC